MRNKTDPAIKQRRRKLYILFLTVILFYHLLTIPPLLIYTPEKIDEQPLLTFLYSKIQAEHIQSINLFIDNSHVLSILKRSEIARSIMLLLGCSIPFFMPMLLYRKNTIKIYMPRMKAVKNVATRGNMMFAAIIISMTLSVVVNFLFSGQEISSQFPPFNIKHIVFWFRYIFIVCVFGPYSEELLFRGVFLDEIKECYILSPRSIIFCQAVVFYGLHIIFSGNFAIQPLLIGIITGAFCFYTNSLLYGLVLHICNNIIVVMLLTGVINIGKLEVGYSFLLLSVLFLGLTFLCLHLFIKHMKKVAIL
jgi:membrane protease YdiL (CAAX protease family)